MEENKESHLEDGSKARWPILAALKRLLDNDDDENAEKVITAYVDNKVHVADTPTCTTDEDCEDNKVMDKIDKTGCTVKKLCRYYESKQGSPPKTAKELLLYAIENNINIKLGKIKVIDSKGNDMDDDATWTSLLIPVQPYNASESISWSVVSPEGVSYSGSITVANTYDSETGTWTVNYQTERTNIITTMVAGST